MWGNLFSAIGKGVKRGATALVDRFDGDSDAISMGQSETSPAPQNLPIIDQDPMVGPPGRGPNPDDYSSVDPLTGERRAPRIPLPDLRKPAVAKPAAPPPLLTPPEGMKPKEVGPPQDYRGRPIEDSVAFERDQWMRPRGEVDESGKFKVRRSLKDALINAGLGFMRGAATGEGLGGAIGGALVGGAGTAIDPLRGQEFRFDMTERPRIEEEQQRQRMSRKQRIEDAIQQAAVDRIPLDRRKTEADVAHTQAQTQVALDNAKRQQALTESQIELNKARTEAATTGKVVYKDIVQDGEVVTVAIHPDQSTTLVGRSGAAEISHDRNESAERRAKIAQAGATTRTGMTQAGANSRNAANITSREKIAQDKLNAAGNTQGAGGSKLRKSNAAGGATPDQIQQIISEAKKRGQTVTEEQVRARLKARGQ